MRSRVTQFLALSLVIVAIRCGQEAPEYVPPTIEEPVYVEPDYTDVEWSGLTDTSVGVEDYITIEGYVGLYDQMFYSSGSGMSFDLFQRRNQSEGFCIDVSGPTGNGRNQIQELPENFSQYSLKVVCDDSTIVQPGAYVKVYCRISSTDSTGVSVNMMKVEKVEKTWEGRYFSDAIELTESIVRDTMKTKIYSYMDGKLALTDAFLSTNGRVTLDFRQSNNKMVKTVSVQLGSTLPSTVDSPPDYYSSSDLTYRDCDKTTLGPSDKIRVYGTWSRNYDNTSGYFSVEEIVKL